MTNHNIQNKFSKKVNDIEKTMTLHLTVHFNLKSWVLKEMLLSFRSKS